MYKPSNQHNEFNAAVRKWSASTAKKLQRTTNQFVQGKATATGKEDKLKFSIRQKTYAMYLRVYRIGFEFVRHGVYVEKGVGRGRPVGSIKTRPQPWFNPTIAAELPRLGQAVQEHFVQVNVDSIFIR